MHSSKLGQNYCTEQQEYHYGPPRQDAQNSISETLAGTTNIDWNKSHSRTPPSNPSHISVICIVELVFVHLKDNVTITLRCLARR